MRAERRFIIKQLNHKTYGGVVQFMLPPVTYAVGSKMTICTESPANPFLGRLLERWGTCDS